MPGPLGAVVRGRPDLEANRWQAFEPLERTPLEGPEGAYKKIVADPAGMDALLLEVFVEAHPEPPEEVILDVDATDDPLHGKQEGRFFHGYYKRYATCPVRLLWGHRCPRSRRGPRGRTNREAAA